ncbi:MULTISPECIES: DJ-1/PfpI family protein [Phenylobacterium]|uniref:Intracellular protease/amidase n=1 Tax=Phenylobacterium koreense TaxID=266125 RepID=A0ABV2EFL1_9CAUL
MAKHLAFILIDDFADWEHARLSAAFRSYFAGRVSFHTPGGQPVLSMGGMRFAPEHAIEDLRPDDYDGLAVIGSAGWSQADAPDISAVLQAADEAGKVVGAICAATLAAARAGLMNGRRHTSNSLGFLKAKAAGYDASAFYVDTPAAVREGNLVTAAGNAPVTFATEMICALYPDRGEAMQEFRDQCGREFTA